MAIAVTCSCGKRYRVKDEGAGKQIRCPSCKGVISIPNHSVGPPTTEPETFALANSLTTSLTPAAPSIIPTGRCPRCGFSYGWDGRDCSHCHNCGSMQTCRKSRNPNGGYPTANWIRAALIFVAGVFFGFTVYAVQPILGSFILLGVTAWAVAHAMKKPNRTARVPSPPPSVQIECPDCSQTLKLSDAQIGRRVQCKECGNFFRATRPLTADKVSLPAAISLAISAGWLAVVEGVHPQRVFMASAAALGIVGALMRWIPLAARIGVIDISVGKFTAILLLAPTFCSLFFGKRHEHISGVARVGTVGCALIVALIAAVNRFSAIRLFNYDIWREMAREDGAGFLWEVPLLAMWRHPAKIIMPTPTSFEFGDGLYLTLLSALTIIGAAFLLAPSRFSARPIPLVVLFDVEALPKGSFGYWTSSLLYLVTLVVFLWQFISAVGLGYIRNTFSFLTNAVTEFAWGVLWIVPFLTVIFAAIDGGRLVALYRHKPLSIISLIQGVILSWAVVLGRWLAIIVPSGVAVTMILMTLTCLVSPGRKIGEWVTVVGGHHIRDAYDKDILLPMMLLISVVIVPFGIWLSCFQAKRWSREWIAGLSYRKRGFREVWLRIFASRPHAISTSAISRKSGKRVKAREVDGVRWKSGIPYTLATVIVLGRVVGILWRTIAH